MESGVPPYPGLNTSMLVSPIVVHDQVQIQFRRGFIIDRFEEPNELLMAMPWHTVADDPTVKRDQCGEQRRRSVPFVIVRHRATTALLHRQSRLRAVERLNLRLLVDAQHKRFIRRIEIQPDYVIDLLDKVLVPAQPEGLGQVRLELMLSPDASHRRFADPLSPGHQSAAPVSRIFRPAVKRGLDDSFDLPVGDSRDAAGAGRILLDSPQAHAQKTLPPQLHRRARHPQRSRNFLTLHAAGSHLNNLCALNQPRRQGSAMRPTSQSFRFGRGEYDGSCSSAHEPHHTSSRTICQANYDALH